MNAKLKYWTFALFAMLLVAAWFVQPAQGSSAHFNQPVTNSCLTCHEDLYYLHDTGKWYCIAEHKEHCIDCHEGDPATLNKEASHHELAAHPQANNGEKCQECHPQDAAAHLAKFASLGGYSEISQPVSYTPAQPISLGAPEVTKTNGMLERLPWVLGGAVLFVLWLILVLFSPTKP